MPRTIKTALPPEFTHFAEMTGCDDKGQNEFPVTVNPDNVEVINYFSDLTGGQVARIHFTSGHQLLIKTGEPAPMPTEPGFVQPQPATSDVQGGATALVDKEDTFERERST